VIVQSLAGTRGDVLRDDSPEHSDRTADSVEEQAWTRCAGSLPVCENAVLLARSKARHSGMRTVLIV
jgi:hypothetical protein